MLIAAGHLAYTVIPKFASLICSDRSRFTLEHLRAMPVNERWRGMMFLSHRRIHLSAVMPEENFFEALASMRLLRYEHATIVAQRERADIEKLVMHAAKRDAVLHHVWAARLMPFDVRGFEADREVADAQVEIAKRAAVLVCDEHGVAERGIASAAFRLSVGCWQKRRVVVQRKTGCIEYVAVDALGEMRIE
jgi:hypothetical protein